MPPNFQPSNTQLQLAYLVASQSGLSLPQRYLPSAFSLSILLWFGGIYLGATVLAPRWFLRWHAFLYYRPAPIESINQNDQRDTTPTTTTPSDSDLSVLLRIPLLLRDDDNNNSGTNGASNGSRAICPLHRTHRGDRAPYCFWWQHCRYYWDGEIVTEGGPTLHQQTIGTLKEQAQVGLSSRKDFQTANRLYRHDLLDASQGLLPPTIWVAFLHRLVSSPLIAFQLMGKLMELLESGLVPNILDVGTTLGQHFWNARQSIAASRDLSKEVYDDIQNSMTDAHVEILRPALSAPANMTEGNTTAAKKSQKEQNDSNNKKKQTKKSKKKKTTNEPKNHREKEMGWHTGTAQDLLPGDVFTLSPSNRKSPPKGRAGDSLVVPVDALLLEGSCVANEAVLTGESVPQTKFPLENSINNSTGFDMAGKHRNSVLFAGTTVTGSSDGKRMGSTLKCLVLRTGSYSSRGDLTRALKSSRGGGKSLDPYLERASLRLVVVSSVGALCSCAWLIFSTITAGQEAAATTDRGTTGGQRSGSKLFDTFIRCTRILSSSVPGYLPMTLGTIGSRCSSNLRRHGQVVCSDPAALFTASRTDVVVMDKTGTLTADTQSLRRTELPPTFTNTNTTSSIEFAPDQREGAIVLAGCHALIASTQNETTTLVGDPLDYASYRYSKWRYRSKDQSFNLPMKQRQKASPSDIVKFWQIQTFPFDPQRRASSAVLLVQDQSGMFSVRFVLKGSTDALQRHVVGTPNEEWYKSKTTELGTDGTRSIALFTARYNKYWNTTEYLRMNPLERKKNGALSTKALRRLRETVSESLSRDEIENGSDFHSVGLGCFEATLRPSTTRVVRELKRRVNVVMLTGDGIDAAVSIGKETGIVDSHKPIAVLSFDETTSKVGFSWRNEQADNVKSCTSVAGILQLVQNGLCTVVASGNAIEAIESATASYPTEKSIATIQDLLLHCAVVASASPDQKALFVGQLKEAGKKNVLMCGTLIGTLMALSDGSIALHSISQPTDLCSCCCSLFWIPFWQKVMVSTMSQQ